MIDDETCYWTYAEFDDYYDSTCGHAFSFNYDRKDDPEFQYCPYCGHEILWIEPDGETEKD